MRTDCRHYESRTYKSGEIVRKCALDLAPEAPWRCPGECTGFQLRRYDAGWQYGSLGKPAVAPDVEPEGIAALDEAEDIVNLAAPDILSEFEKKNRKRASSAARRRSRAPHSVASGDGAAPPQHHVRRRRPTGIGGILGRRHRLQAETVNEFVAILSGDGSVGPGLMFIKVPEGKSTKNRMHVDLGSRT